MDLWIGRTEGNRRYEYEKQPTAPRSKLVRLSTTTIQAMNALASSILAVTSKWPRTLGLLWW